MGIVKKALLYAGAFALGMGVCYFSCVDRKYNVVEHCGNLYVEHEKTGMLAEVDDEFEIRNFRSDIGVELCESGDSIADRIEDAYKALTR